MFMIYLRAKFHVPDLNGSLVIPMKPKAKENFRPAAIVIFYNMQENCPCKSWVCSSIVHYVST
jgi:hypothetical protein